MLPAVLALLAAAAPACFAQEARASAEQREPATTKATVGAATPGTLADSQPRSAFGRVMSLMIAALKENADRGPERIEVNLDDASGGAAPAPRDIQVSAAFRLDAPPASSRARADGDKGEPAPLAGISDSD